MGSRSKPPILRVAEVIDPRWPGDVPQIVYREWWGRYKTGRKYNPLPKPPRFLVCSTPRKRSKHRRDE